MKRTCKIAVSLLFVLAFTLQAEAQCSLCSKTAMQLGEGPAKGLNGGILYLMIIPLSLIFFIGYKWYRREQQIRKQQNS